MVNEQFHVQVHDKSSRWKYWSDCLWILKCIGKYSALAKCCNSDRPKFILQIDNNPKDTATSHRGVLKQRQTPDLSPQEVRKTEVRKNKQAAAAVKT